MALQIEEAITNSQLKKFIKFPNKLYKGNPYYIPPIIDFELSTLQRKKNPAFDFCEAKYWLVYQDKEIVGRIAAIIHGMEVQEKPIGRFGWIDFTDEEDVFALLMNTAIDWLKTKDLTQIHGPLGFTDLDFEGTLISGFDQLATQATIYNHPYYQKHFEQFGFKKACDWLEVRVKAPKELPKRLPRIAQLVTSRFKISVKKFKSNKEILKYAPGFFNVLNETYSDLYGYYPLTENQIEYYTKMYFGFIRREFITILVNEHDEVIGFGLTLPSLSKAFQKAKGSLYPFGFIHVLKAFNSNKHIDMFLIGVLPKYQKLGANTLIFNEILSNYIEKGVEYLTTGPMMENNKGVLNLWHEYKEYIEDVNIRRRCFIKPI